MTFRRLLRWTLDHTFLMGWRFRPLRPRELIACLLTTVALGALIGVAIGTGALLVTGAWTRALSIELRAVTLTLVFSLLFFFTGGLTGVYLVPLTLRLSQSFGSLIRGVLFFLAGVISMAAGLRFFTPITRLRLAPGLAPVIAIADGVIICVLGLLIVRFHQLEAEMRQAYDSLRHQQERETQLRELATRAELTALQAQINPHFLFNTLNSISALIGKDAVRANHALEKLAGLFRYTLGASRRPTVRLEEEWRFVQDYLSIESIRLGPRLKIEATLDPAARDWPLPGLLLQPIVENAVVHGVALYPSGGKVRLTARLIGETLQIEISDVPLNPAESGASPAATMLRTPADGHGHAIENIRRRLEAAYPGRHQLSFESQPGQGTRVTLEIAAEAAPAAATLSQAVQRES